MTSREGAGAERGGGTSSAAGAERGDGTSSAAGAERGDGTSSAAALEVEHLESGYAGVMALHDVSISARPGTITAVLGANGAGKTTLLATISGFVRPRQGRVTLDGTDLTRRAPEEITRAGIAHVPEGQAVITELTVEENLRVGGLGRRGQAGRSAALEDAFKRFPILAAARHRSASTLSGGERQILVIARALMASPKVLLLDEPSLGLAPRIVAQVMALIQRLRDENGLTVVLVEQNARSALAIADLGVVLNVGRVVVIEDAAVLAADEALRKHYLGF
jgi:branched-chain amino acid transport system ATP-binding protein